MNRIIFAHLLLKSFSQIKNNNFKSFFNDGTVNINNNTNNNISANNLNMYQNSQAQIILEISNDHNTLAKSKGSTKGSGGSFNGQNQSFKKQDYDEKLGNTKNSSQLTNFNSKNDYLNTNKYGAISHNRLNNYSREKVDFSIKDGSHSPAIKKVKNEQATFSQTEGTTTDEILLNQNLKSVNPHNIIENNEMKYSNRFRKEISPRLYSKKSPKNNIHSNKHVYNSNSPINNNKIRQTMTLKGAIIKSGMKGLKF